MIEFRETYKTKYKKIPNDIIILRDVVHDELKELNHRGLMIKV